MIRAKPVALDGFNRLARRFVLVTMAWLAWLTVGASVRAEDSLVITTNHYLVSGTTLRELRQSIDRVRPGGPKNGSDGLTVWQIKWNSRTRNGNGECRLVSFDMTTTITVTMPSWRAPTNAPPEMMKRWVAYYAALQRHEQHHVESAKLAAVEVRKQVEAIGPERDCSALGRRIQETVDAILAQFRKRDVDYDRETDHGRKEGARLP